MRCGSAGRCCRRCTDGPALNKKTSEESKMAHKTTWHPAGVGALLLTAALAAQAQTEVTPYGVLDFSYGRFEPSGALPEHRFNSNSMSASFVGVNLKRGLE